MILLEIEKVKKNKVRGLVKDLRKDIEAGKMDISQIIEMLYVVEDILET